jgi:3-hydroxyisobutyrate dehydrogenase-like beta-hydroxyacid dehydrogenase
MTPKIALLGTGLMGFPMSRNIAIAGFDLTVWNRTRDKAAALSAHDVAIADTIENAVQDADIIISMLSDGAAVLATAAIAKTRLKKGMIWIDMSSTKPAEARQLGADLNSIGVSFLDAPVSGGAKGAEAGTLAIMVGGDTDTFEKAMQVFKPMGRATLVGPTGAGQLAKLANQAIVAVTIGAVAEAMLLLEENGADATAVRAALKGGFADSTILQQHGARMSNRDFDPGGLTKLQLKDLDNVLAEAGLLKLPVVQHVRDRFHRYMHEMDGGDRDHSGLFEELRDLNGLPRSDA